MGSQVFSNFASSLLATSINDVETTVQVGAGEGDLFPNPGIGDWFVIALEDNQGNIEVCKCTSRTADVLTVVRGWEGTVAQAFTAGYCRVELRDSKGTYEQFLQRTGDVLSGDLDLDGNQLIDAILVGELTRILEGAVCGVPIKNSNCDDGNAITIPEDGVTAPSVGGSTILTNANFDPNSVFPAGFVVMWWGDVNEIPSGWALCDGNNGRPDLQNRFVVGVGTDYAAGDFGGTDLYTGLATSLSGGHSHTGYTDRTVLDTDDMPAHTHRLWIDYSTGSGGAVQGLGGSNSAITGNGTSIEGYHEYSGSGDRMVETTGGVGDGHNHVIFEELDHLHTTDAFDNRPPYWALYFIIKVDPQGSYGGLGVGNPSVGQYDLYDEDGCTTYIGGKATLMDDVDIVSNYAQIECCASNVFRIFVDANVTLLPPNNPISGQVINVILKFDGTGGYTVTLPSNFRYSNGVAPTLDNSAGAKHILTCQYDSHDQEWLVTALQSFAAAA